MRKLLLSFLSSNKLVDDDGNEKIFKLMLGNGESNDIRVTNESVTKWLIDTGMELDIIYMIQTEAVMEKHWGLFCGEIEKFCKERNIKPPEIVPIKYSEDEQSVILEMCEKIISEKENAGAEVYIDATGGFRTASMMLMVVMKLLEYSNIKTKGIYYANISKSEIEIKDCNYIYDLYAVQSGAEAFVKYGNVELIYSYFKKKGISSELKCVLKKMREFAATLKICKSSNIVNSIKELGQAIEEYKAVRECVKADERIFDLLLYKIENEFEVILKEPENLPEIIKWCCEKKYIQQAITLYVELMPDYFVDNGIIYPSNKDDFENERNEFIRNKYYITRGRYMLTEYTYKKKFRTNIGIGDNTQKKIKCKNQKCLAAVKKYYDINDKRNQINHANNKNGEESAVELLNNIGDEIKRCAGDVECLIKEMKK